MEVRYTVMVDDGMVIGCDPSRQRCQLPSGEMGPMPFKVAKK